MNPPLFSGKTGGIAIQCGGRPYYQAFLVAPHLAPQEPSYLYDHEWNGEALPERFGELVAKYDPELDLLQRAAHSKVPCDWGIDLTAGPATLPPHLGRGKMAATAARWRARWELQNGRPAEACQDLIAGFVLGRNLARDGTIVSTLVQMAIENIICSAAAESLYQFPSQTLKQLIEGMDAAPPNTQ